MKSQNGTIVLGQFEEEVSMARRVKTFPLTIPSVPPQRSKGIWVMEALRIAIMEGRLAAGSQVPSSRDLAKQWGISRGLVSAAYEELQAQGYLESVAGSGTYVGGGWLRPCEPGPAYGLPTGGSPVSPLDERPRIFRLNPEKPFVSRETDVSLFPIGTWRKLAHSVLSETDNAFFYEADPAGNVELRRQIARYLGSARGLNCVAEDIIITTGTRHSIDLCLRALTSTGDKVWTEKPGYAGAEELLAIHGLVPVPVSVDLKGFRVESAEEIASDVKLCIVTPSHQSPLGVRLSFERRQRLLAWANRIDGYIIEDDYDGEFSFERVRFPAFKAMDVGDRVIHAGSFNKVLFPTLRIGYLIAPRSLRSRLIRLRAETGRNNSILDQHILARFIAEGYLSQHIRRMGSVYHEKCQAAVEGIRNAYGDKLDVFGDHGGFHFCIRLPPDIDIEALHSKLRQNDFVIPTAAIHTSAGFENALVVGYSSLALETIKHTAAKLGQLLRECRGR